MGRFLFRRASAPGPGNFRRVRRVSSPHCGDGLARDDWRSRLVEDQPEDDRRSSVDTRAYLPLLPYWEIVEPGLDGVIDLRSELIAAVGLGFEIPGLVEVDLALHAIARRVDDPIVTSPDDP